MPSGVLVWTATGTPALLAVSTASFISSSEKVGRAPGRRPSDSRRRA